jgi:hypothetical protein
MMSRRAQLVALAVVLAAATYGVSAAACGLEGGLGDAWSAAHAGSLEVALATRDAIASGALLPDPVLEPALAHERADEHVRRLAAALPMGPSATPVAVLVIEPGLWTRLTPQASVWIVAEHADGPQASDAALIVSESALRDLVGGRLSADEALQRGVLALSHEKCCRESLLVALRQAYPSQVSTAALR